MYIYRMNSSHGTQCMINDILYTIHDIHDTLYMIHHTWYKGYAISCDPIPKGNIPASLKS